MGNVILVKFPTPVTADVRVTSVGPESLTAGAPESVWRETTTELYERWSARTGVRPRVNRELARRYAARGAVSWTDDGRDANVDDSKAGLEARRARRHSCAARSGRDVVCSDRRDVARIYGGRLEHVHDGQVRAPELHLYVAGGQRRVVAEVGEGDHEPAAKR